MCTNLSKLSGALGVYPPRVGGAFVIGANFPWVTCGHDFGPRPPAWNGAPPTDWAKVRDELEGLAAIGVRVVRFWILAGGINYPVGRDPIEIAREVPFTAPYPSRWAWAKGRAFRFEPREAPPLPRAFLDDFAALLEACRAAGVRLIPSLLSFEMLLPIVEQKGGPKSGGRGAFVLGPLRARFLDATLEPLLEVSELDRDAIFAWEVMNEPDWPALPTRHRGPYAPPDALSAFLLEGAERIARRGFLATIGFCNARPTWLAPSAQRGLARLAASGRYLHQRHFYAREDLGMRLPPAAWSAIQPCLLGELPTAQARRWADPELWDTEADPDRYLEARIALAKERGYTGALVWAVKSDDPQTRWDDRVRAQIRRAAHAT